MPLFLSFHGGAGTVTGSRFELEANGHHFLIDCGLFQGLKPLRELNWQPPRFNARALEAVFLTHAHIDHSGYLPRLVKEGYRGPIYCTEATAELAELLLLDAAKLQEEDADFANRKGFSKHHPALPLFDEEDATRAIRRLRPVPFGKMLDAGPLGVKFRHAGHILGAAFIEFHLETQPGNARIVFSGDLGRVNQPLHVDPDPLPECDTLVLESTYGDRDHNTATFASELGAAFRRTIKRGGTILIPAFAVARAQLITLLLEELREQGEIPDVPVHIDSPMAVDATSIYERHSGTKLLDALPPGRKRLLPRTVQLHRTVQESKELGAMRGSRIIISASGMLTGGRVLHHLERLLPDPKNLIVLSGYQAAGTRGRALQEGALTVRMHGQDIPVRAEVLNAEGLSAHADRKGLIEWVQSAPKPPRSMFLVHGEPEATAALAEDFKRLGMHPLIPRMDERFQFEPTSKRWKSAGRVER
ncbi:MAG: MBL fold metallo-hydrolase [Anaerolinea sp.]|nr:MBL fold metallo-hydrolase [Anaerolinea sp.]